MNGLLLLLAFAAAVPPEEGKGAETPASSVVALVDGEPIRRDEVERELSIAGRAARAATASDRDVLFDAALRQVVDRRLVERWLRETRQSASPSEVDLALQQLREKQAQRGQSLDDFLRQQRLDEAGLRRALAWQLGWGRFLTRQLTKANLEKYFHQHRREFDGTELRVAQLLLKVAPGADDAFVADTRTRARDLAAKIRSGELTFAEAARKYSESPSRDRGGDIGWISRREPMPEAFSRAAFALEPDQISEPVETVYGIHLIQCLEVRPGQKRWEEVQPQLEEAVTRYLFTWAANQVRGRAAIDYPPRHPTPHVPGAAPNASR